MPHDCHHEELKKGSKIKLCGTVEEILSTGKTCNVRIKAEHGDVQPSYFVVNADQLECCHDHEDPA